MFKNIFDFLKKYINNINILIKKIWEKFLIFLYNFTFYFLLIVKYMSVFFGLLLILIHYKSINFETKNLNINESKVHVKDIKIIKKDYLKYNGYLLKSYSYYFWNKNFYIKSNFQNLKFIINNQYYDEDGYPITENNDKTIEYIKDENKKELLIKVNINKDFLITYIKEILYIYNFFKKIIEKLSKDSKLQIVLNHISFRWNVVITYGNYKYTIKLPDMIDSKTIKKISYIESNLDKFFKDKDIIFDLRFQDIIIV